MLAAVSQPPYEQTNYAVKFRQKGIELSWMDQGQCRLHRVLLYGWSIKKLLETKSVSCDAMDDQVWSQHLIANWSKLLLYQATKPTTCIPSMNLATKQHKKPQQWIAGYNSLICVKLALFKCIDVFCGKIGHLECPKSIFKLISPTLCAFKCLSQDWHHIVLRWTHSVLKSNKGFQWN